MVASVPPPSPVHRPSPIPRLLPRDDDDAVVKTTDSTVVIRMTPQHRGEEILSVEMEAEEELGEEREEKSEATKQEQKTK